jgi:predicted neutral ceramidase superfamily lipid hydrolase
MYGEKKMQVKENVNKNSFLLILTLSTFLFSALLFTLFKQVQLLLFGFLMAFLFLTMLLNLYTGHRNILAAMYMFLIIAFTNFVLVLTVIENNDALKILLMKIALISGVVAACILFVECFFAVRKIISHK